MLGKVIVDPHADKTIYVLTKLDLLYKQGEEVAKSRLDKIIDETKESAPPPPRAAAAARCRRRPQVLKQQCSGSQARARPAAARRPPPTAQFVELTVRWWQSDG